MTPVARARASAARAVWLGHAPTAQVVLDLLAHAVIPGR
jgi:hypothetical protein